MLLSPLRLLTVLHSDSGGPAAVDINYVPFVLAVVGLPAGSCRLQYILVHPCFCLRSYCVGRPVVAFIPAVVGSHAFAVILAVAYCWRHCCCLHSCYC